MKSIEQERVRIAYHEAGHAVASIILGHPIASITLVPEKDNLGSVVPDAEDSQNRDNPYFHRREILIGFAGAAAEILLNGTVEGNGIGFAGASGFTEGSDLAIAKQRMDYLKEAYPFQKAVANPLELALRLLTKHWASVVAVAEAVLEKGTLESTDVTRIIGWRRSRRALNNGTDKRVVDWLRQMASGFQRI